jgi:hypothetical protein
MRCYFGRAARALPLVILAIALPLNVAAQRTRRGAAARKAQGREPAVRFDSGGSALRIPLEIDNNIILMPVSVNGSKPLKFIFDTGASHNVISSRRAAELGLKIEGTGKGSGTGGTFQMSYTRGVSLGVPGAEVSEQLVASMPFPTIPGFEFDGTIGYDFINQFVVEIDYQNKIMSLYDPRAYAYRGAGRVVPLVLAGRRTPLAHTTISLEGRAPIGARLEVDTGADGAFVINSPFVRKHGLLSAIPETTQGGAVGAGGEQQLRVGRVKAVRLGRLVIDNPAVGLSLDAEGAGASEENDGLIGGEVFRRFKVILDYSRRRMILEPNSDFGDPY